MYKAKHIVVDPVMVATSGAKLLRDDAVAALTAELLPLAEVLTPNIPEAEILAGMDHHRRRRTWRPPPGSSARSTAAPCCARAATRSTMPTTCCGRTAPASWFRGKRIHNPNTHGTGCTLSSAIASNLAKGYDLDTVGGAGQSLHFRRTGRHAGPRARLRPHGPHVCIKPSKEEVRAVKKTSTFQNGLIWFGAGVSLAEILTGTSFAPLGMAKGSAGHSHRPRHRLRA